MAAFSSEQDYENQLTEQMFGMVLDVLDDDTQARHRQQQYTPPQSTNPAGRGSSENHQLRLGNSNSVRHNSPQRINIQELMRTFPRALITNEEVDAEEDIWKHDADKFPNEHFDLKRRLLLLKKATGFSVVRIQGQRICGPPQNWERPEPTEPGSEIYVCRLVWKDGQSNLDNLPYDMYEDELLPVFDKVAPVYRLRVLIHFSGYIKGYLYVRYGSKEDAQRAVTTLNGFRIRPDCRLAVQISADCRLMEIQSLALWRSAEWWYYELSKHVRNIVEVAIVAPENYEYGSYALLIEFASHQDNCQARRTLMPMLPRSGRGEILHWGNRRVYTRMDRFRPRQVSRAAAFEPQSYFSQQPPAQHGL